MADLREAIGVRPAARRARPARPCAAGCGSWADFEVGGVALCRDCAEALAEAYGLRPGRRRRGEGERGSAGLR
jgi:hypothetical protein